MEFQPRATALIKTRFSCRTYARAPIEENIRQQLQNRLDTLARGPLGTIARFRLIAAGDAQREALRDFGTYGFIRDAAGFIVGAVPGRGYNLEDYGYLMEHHILSATGMGLATCWLGGTFTQSTFADAISAGEDEVVPAVAAIGYPANRKRLFERVIRWGAGSDNRKPAHELFFQNDFRTPLTAVQDGLEPLAMVRLAPSASNRQPWRVVVDAQQQHFHFYLQRTKRYYTRNRLLFNMADMQRIDMGIAMCHFELSCREQGRRGHWLIRNPDLQGVPELTAYTATWSEDRDEHDRDL